MMIATITLKLGMKNINNTVILLLLNMVLSSLILSQEVVGTISRPEMVPTSIAVYEAGNKVYIADKTSGNLYIYNSTTLEELGLLHLELDQINDMVVDEVYGKLYADDYWLVSKIAVVDVKADTLIHYITSIPAPGATPAHLALDEGLHKVYAIHNAECFQIDVVTDDVIKIPTITGGIADIAINPVTHEVFMCGYQKNRLDIVNGITLEHTTIPDIKGWGVGVNYLENKVYICYYNMGEYNNTICIYDRDTSTITPFQLDNDAVSIVFNPTSNRMYTSSEINHVSSIIEGPSDSHFNLPIQSPTSAPAVRYSTNHIYYAGRDYIAVLDDSTQLLEIIPVENPYADQGGLVSQQVTINQTNGCVYVINDGLNLNFVTVIQDTETMIRPPIYLGNSGFPAQIHMLDPVSKEVAECLSALGYGFPYLFGIDAHAMAVRPGGGRLYVPSGGMGVDGLTTYAGTGPYADINYFEIGGRGSVVPAIMPDGSKIYIANSISDNVSVVDLLNNIVITTIQTGDKPWGASVTPDGSKVLVSNKGDNSVSVINTSSNTVIGTIPVGIEPWGLTINPGGTKAYVANSNSGTVSVIDIESMTVVATVTVESNPHWLTITPDGKHVYVSNTESNTVSVIDAGADTVVQNVTVDGNPEGICALPNGREVYVGTDSTVSVINTSDYSMQVIRIPPVSTFSGSYIKIISLAVPDPTSRFAGRVTNGGVPVNNALIRAIQAGAEKGSASTNAEGDYSVFNLKSGTYDVEISAPGFYSQILSAQNVGAGNTTVLHFDFMSIGVADDEKMPTEFSLNQNYPNPFNPNTTIYYSLPNESAVTITVYDVLGKEINQLISQIKPQGNHSVEWNGNDNFGNPVSAGIYLYQIQTGDFVQTKKMVLMK